MLLFLNVKLGLVLDSVRNKGMFLGYPRMRNMGADETGYMNTVLEAPYFSKINKIWNRSILGHIEDAQVPGCVVGTQS